MKNLFLLICTALILSSCGTTTRLFEKPVNGFEENDALLKQYFSLEDPKLQAGDKITISVWGHEALSVGSINSVFNSNEASGRWILLNDEGEVHLPKVGRVKLAGLTSKEANYLLEQKYTQYLKQPIINVRVLNHYVTVLGEVNSPGRYSLQNETITLIQIIGASGGLSEFAESQSIELIRNINGKPIKKTVDLTSFDSLEGLNFALQPDDIVHIPAKESKSFNKRLEKAAPVISIISGIAVLISVLAK